MIREIDEWLARKSAGRILSVVTAGEWHWDAASGSLVGDAVPDPLQRRFAEEPRHLDLRWAHDEDDLDLHNVRFRDAIADLAAPMHGVSKDDIEGEDVRQHRRARRLARSGVCALAFLVVMSLVFGTLALEQRSKAVAARDRAAQQATRANQEARLADARRLASAATSGTADDLSRSGLLAIEANRLVDDAETRGAILSVAEAAAPVREILHGSWNAAAVTADGRTAVTVGGNGVSLIDLPTRRSRSISRHNFGDIRSVAFSPNGSLLALGGDDLITIIDVRTGRTTGRPRRITDPATDGPFVAHVHFSPDGTRLAAIDSEGAGDLWSVPSGVETAQFGVDYFGNGVTNDVAFSPDSRWLAATDVGGGLVGLIIDAQRSTPKHLQLRYPKVPDAEFADYDVAFSPDGTRLAASTDRGDIQFRNTATGMKVGLSISSGPGTISSVAFSRDGHVIAGARTDGTVSVWDPRSGAVLAGEVLGTTRKPLALSFTPDGTLVVLTAAEIVVSDPAARLAHNIAAATSGGWNNTSLAAAGDGRSIAVGDSLGRVRIWNQKTGHLQQTIFATGLLGGGVLSLAYEPTTNTIVVGAGDGTVTAWDIRSGRRVGGAIRVTAPNVGVSTALELGVLGVAFDARGRTLAAAAADGRVVVIDPSTWRIRRTLRLVTGNLEAIGQPLAFSADGHTIAVAAHTVGIGAADGVDRRVLGVGAFDIASLAIAPNGHILAVGLEDGRVLIANTTPARVETTIFSNHGAIESLVFNSTGTTLAVGGSDATVTLWNVADHQPVGPPLTSAQSESVVGMAFSPDGEQLFAANRDTSTVRYSLDTAQQITRLCSVIGRNLTVDERHDDLADPNTGRQTCPNWPVDR